MDDQQRQQSDLSNLHEPAISVVFQGYSFTVECIDCGIYEILELAAQHIQQFAHDDRLRLLAKAKRASDGQDGPPLIREPLDLA